MPTAQTAQDAVFELVHTRSEFLMLLDTEAYEKRALVDELSVSRSTVDRTLRELDTAQLVEEQSGQYRTTFYGHLLLAVYHALLDTLDHVQQAQPLLALLPVDAEIDFSLFVDAEVHVAEDPALHVPATRVAELVDAATEIKALAYANTSSEASDLLRRKIQDGMAMEVVLRQDMFTALKEADTEVVTELLASESYTAYVTEDLPYGLFLFQIDGEWQLCLLIYGPNQNLQGVIVNDDSEALAWAYATFKQYRSDATPVAQSEQTDKHE